MTGNYKHIRGYEKDVKEMPGEGMARRGRRPCAIRSSGGVKTRANGSEIFSSFFTNLPKNP